MYSARFLFSLRLLIYPAILVGLLFTMAAGQVPAPKIAYPPSRTTNDVDFYNGIKVFDPYRWLEDMDSPETQAWVELQDSLTRSYLDSIPYRNTIKERLMELSESSASHRPFRRGEWYFFYDRKSGENQYALYRKHGLDGEPEKVLDPNPLSADGTVAITALNIDDKGSLVAYALSSGGSDWQEVRFKDIESGRDYDEVLKWCKFVETAWAPDYSGIFYDRWPEPGTVPEKDELHYKRLYYHRIGTSQETDSLIFEDKKDKRTRFTHRVTSDGRYQLLNVWREEKSRHDIYYRDLSGNGPFRPLKEKCESYYIFIENFGTTFYFRTGIKSPGGKVVAADLSNPQKISWREIVPATDRVMDGAKIIDSCLVLTYLENAYHRVIILDLDGIVIREVELPAIGTVNDVYGYKSDSLMFITFESFVYPRSTYIYDFRSGELKLYDKADIKFDLSPYVTRQIQYESFGGVKVPMFLTYRDDLKLNGANPTILYGYGGFGISILPWFSESILLWLENGGIFAVANIRGGGEYGWNWHRGGIQNVKQTSFDDFANAAKWLIDKKLTSRGRLASMGGSNGGLLVAACMEQNPDLFGAVICQVPLTDMVRFTEFTVGDRWVNEYGNPKGDKYMLGYLKGYSPYHNVSVFSKYPPMLVTTGENDDRVPPLHSYKFVAALQAQDDGTRPKLLRFEPDSGHGRGKPQWKYIEEQTDILTFLFHSLGLTPKLEVSPVVEEALIPVDSNDTGK